MTDNKGVAERILAPKIRKVVIPGMHKAFRTAKLPAGLDKLEKKYEERVNWPRSIYVYKRLVEQTEPYKNISDRPYELEDFIDEVSDNPWRSSTRFNFDEGLDRNMRALKKAAGLPKFGKKGENLGNAKQYVEEIIKPSSGIDKMFSIMPGFRTQQSSPDEPKVRLVWSIPVSTWYMECEAYDDAITKTISENHGKHSVKLFYCTSEEVHEWYSRQQDRVRDWTNLDSSQYDSTVRRSELERCVRSFAGDYEHCDQLSEYISTASLVMPEGDIVRSGGMPSGSKVTNLGDGWTNVRDIGESAFKAHLSRYIECILVNGDDISIGWSTKLTEANLKKLVKFSRRNISTDKSEVGPFLWNSKWFMQEGLFTRPIFRVLNSMMYKEHQMDPITGSKEYVAIAIAQQLLDVENHPLAGTLNKLMHSIDKYPISTFSQEELRQAAESYIDDHNWMADYIGSPDELISKLQHSAYAEETS